MSHKVVAIVGSYRKGGRTDSAVDAILSGARSQGAGTSKIYLIDKHIEFCRNCRACTQLPGPERGKCTQQDDLESVLSEIDSADAVVLASPLQFGNVTAIFRRMLERLVSGAYWPWGKEMPKVRQRVMNRKAVLVACSAMPGQLIPLLSGAARTLRMTAQMLGARPTATLWIGFSAQQEHQALSPRTVEKARRIGMRLA